MNFVLSKIEISFKNRKNKKRKKKDEIRRRFLLKGKMIDDRCDLKITLHGVKFLKLSSSVRFYECKCKSFASVITTFKES